jgi:plastocyanin
MKTLLIAASLAVGLLGAAPAAAPIPVASPSPAPAIVVHMADFKFAPATVTIHAGQSVGWINDDAVFHSATATDASWDSGELDQGRTFAHAFATPGTYTYYCDDHTFMKGTVVVVK